MPDEAHMAPASPTPAAADPTPMPVVAPAPVKPAAATLAPRIDPHAPVNAWSMTAASGVMRPSIGGGVPAAAHGGSGPLVVHVAKPQSGPDREAIDRDEAATSHESKG
jgi:hypothetical protein